jgi:tetratricopeptide (TPR) repeat protein
MLSRIDRFKKVVEMEPNSEISHFGLGSVYYDEEKHEEAVACFRRAIEIKPDYTAAYELLGRSLEKSGRTEEAKEVYRKGVEVGGRTGDHIPTQKMEDRLRRLNKPVKEGP